MKSTGIIRRVDDLGRVVIPKEIRRTLRIHENDPMELFIADNCVCFRKYATNALMNYRAQIVAAANLCGLTVDVCDDQKYPLSSGFSTKYTDEERLFPIADVFNSDENIIGYVYTIGPVLNCDQRNMLLGIIQMVRAQMRTEI